jgi:membrane protease subunit HflC
MNRWLTALLLALTLGMVMAFFGVVVLDEREQAFRTLLNEAEPKVLGVPLNRPNLVEPGVYVVIPFVHELYRYDRRNLTYHSTPKPLNTVDRTLVDLDYYVVWRIANPQRFFESNHDESNEDEQRALRRIDELTYSEVREIVNRHTLKDLLSEKRDGVQREITASASAALGPLGIEVVDLRIGGTLYPESNIDRVYERMRMERNRYALKYRAEGDEQARGIRSKADGEAQVIGAEAEREALRLRGEGDAEAARTFAEVYGADPEFYAFVRSLEAYRKSLGEDTTIMLSPKSGFLKYLFDAGGQKPPKP